MSKKNHKPLVQPIKPKQAVPKHRQCPSCHGGRGGVGFEKWHNRKGTHMRTCYQCDVCGFDWIVNSRRVTKPLPIEFLESDIEYDVVEIETR